MKVQHIILSDAGCYEVGNELPDEWVCMTAVTHSVARGLFRRACVYCKDYVTEQYRKIDENPNLELTSDYYWAVLWMILPKPIESSPEQLWDAVGKLISDESALKQSVVEFDGDGMERANVLSEVANRLGIE